jgi:hypothetical protein
VRRLDVEGEQLLTELAAMSSDDGTARAKVRQVFEVLRSLAMTYQIFPGDLHAAQLRAHRESMRLVGEPKAPTWCCDPSAVQRTRRM